jgi:hypothetical protein
VFWWSTSSKKACGVVVLLSSAPACPDAGKIEMRLEPVLNGEPQSEEDHSNQSVPSVEILQGIQNT